MGKRALPTTGDSLHVLHSPVEEVYDPVTLTGNSRIVGYDHDRDAEV